MIVDHKFARERALETYSNLESLIHENSYYRIRNIWFIYSFLFIKIFYITLFEKNKKFGGHANTYDFNFENKNIPIDCGLLSIIKKLSELYKNS